MSSRSSDVSDSAESSSGSDGFHGGIKYSVLTSSNYGIWAIRMKAIFNVQDVWEAIDPSDPTKVVDVKKDQKAIHSLYSALPDEVAFMASEKSTAKGIWEMLKVMYQGANLDGAASVGELSPLTPSELLEEMYANDGWECDEYKRYIDETFCKYKSECSKTEGDVITREIENFMQSEGGGVPRPQKEDAREEFSKLDTCLVSKWNWSVIFRELSLAQRVEAMVLEEGPPRNGLGSEVKIDDKAEQADSWSMGECMNTNSGPKEHDKACIDILFGDGKASKKNDTLLVVSERPEDDSAALLLPHLLLTIGTFGHSTPPQHQQIPPEEQNHKEEQFSRLIERKTSAIVVKPELVTGELEMMDIIVKQEEIVEEEMMSEEPLLKEDSEKVETRTTLADLFAAEPVSFNDRDLSEDKLAVNKKITSPKKNVKKTKKRKDQSPFSTDATRKIYQLIRKVMKKKIHPDVARADQELHGKGGGAHMTGRGMEAREELRTICFLPEARREIV